MRDEARRQSRAASIRQSLRAEVRKFDADRARLEGRLAFYDAAERAVIATGIGTVAGTATSSVGAVVYPAAAAVGAGQSVWGLVGLTAASGVAASAASQAYEVAAGDRDRYSLTEMGISGGVGGLLGPGVRAVGSAARAYRGAKACGGIKSISPRVRSATSKVEDFLSKDMVIKRADDIGFVALSKDGTRRFRLDLQGHGDAPHGHLEIFDPQRKRWIDAGLEHRYYFKGWE